MMSAEGDVDGHINTIIAVMGVFIGGIYGLVGVFWRKFLRVELNKAEVRQIKEQREEDKKQIKKELNDLWAKIDKAIERSDMKQSEMRAQLGAKIDKAIVRSDAEHKEIRKVIDDDHKELRTIIDTEHKEIRKEIAQTREELARYVGTTKPA